ncbi:MAG: MFS transporter [Alphaproteobacteria bacterium]|nr:MFS transporter [Alphaproteobacteria bacterium]
MVESNVPRRARSHLVLRLSLYYGAIFLIVGVKTPFWPVFLAGRGLDPHEISLVFAAAIWLNVVVTPTIGALADRLARRRLMMMVLAATAIGAYLALWGAAGFALLLGLTLVASVAQAAIMPLGDSVTLAAVREDGIDYGRVRVWGSVTFIVAAVASGLVLAQPAAGRLGANAVLALVLAASLLLLGACGAIPGAAQPPRRTPHRSALGALAADARFWLFIAAGAAIQASHQVYYGFGTLYWRSLGFSDAVIGALWGEGVVAEILLFWCGSRLLARLGPLGLMLSGGAAGVVRWGLIGIVPGLLPAFALQLLHALTFGATHLGAMNYLSRRVPPHAAASAQALYAGASAGLCSGIVMLGAGALYESCGGRAYLFMAALSALGIVGVALLRSSQNRDQRPHFL